MARMTGSRFFAETMRSYGVTHLFYVNSIIGNAMREIDKIGVQRVVTHGEKAAAYMADAYSRASRRVGVCLSQDIGSTNLLAGVRDAYMASSPIIAITGGQNDQPRYRHAYQNAEDFCAWDTITKANYSVDTVHRFPDLLRQAFRVATTGTPGPVHLELRGNAGQMLDGEGDFDVVAEERFTHYPAFRPVAEPAAIKDALAELAKASRPIIVAGGGRRNVRGRTRNHQACRDPFDSDRDEFACEIDRAGRAPAQCRRSRQLFAVVRKQGHPGRRSRVLHR
jgi:acetolactate synthase I/II/III large subunit